MGRKPPIGRIEMILLVLLLALIFLHSAGPIWNGDLFWHIASGQIYLETGGLPEHDPLTHTAGERTWIHHEWISQVLLALCDSKVGLLGLRLIRALLVTLAFCLLWLAYRRVSSSFYAAWVALALAWVFAEPNASMRPHLLTWPLAVWICALLLTRDPPWTPRRYFLLAVMTVVWVNLHSSALILPILTGAYLVPRLAARLATRRGKTTSLRHATLVFGITSLGCLVQPAGLSLLQYVWLTPQFNVHSVEWGELLKLSAIQARPVLFLTYLALALAVLWLKLSQRGLPPDLVRSWLDSFPDFWVSVACLALAASHRRMVFFLFLTILYVLREGDRRWRHHQTATQQAIRVEPRLVVALKFTLIATVVLLVVRQFPGAIDPSPVRRGLFPQRASTFLARVQLEGNMFNGPNWGGYLSYRLYPAYQTFMDGRWVLAGRQVLEDHERIYFHQEPDPLLDRYDIDFLVQPLRDMVQLPPLPATDWVLAYVDEVSVILLRRTDRFQTNRKKICDFYGESPELESLARWPELQPGAASGPGWGAQPSILTICAGRQPVDAVAE